MQNNEGFVVIVGAEGLSEQITERYLLFKNNPTFTGPQLAALAGCNETTWYKAYARYDFKNRLLAETLGVPTKVDPAAHAIGVVGTALCRNRSQTVLDGCPPAWVQAFPTASIIKTWILSGKLEKVTEIGVTPNDVFFSLLENSLEDGPNGETAEQMVRFSKAFVEKFSGRLSFDPRARWSTSKGEDGVGYWSVYWGKHFSADRVQMQKFNSFRSFASYLAARYEDKNGRHTLGGGIFSKPE